MMPQALTPVLPTRPRLGFSIESLVGCGDDKRPPPSPPPQPGLTKLPDSPPHQTHRDFGGLCFPRELILARDQQLREQLRDQLLKEQLLRLQQQARQEPHHRLSPLTSPRPRSPTIHQDDEKKAPSPISPIALPPHNFQPGVPLPPQLISLGGHHMPPHLGSHLMPHPLLAQGQVPHIGAPLPPSNCPRDYPLYPWLLSRHGRIFPHGFPGGHDFPTFLLPFRKPKRIRTAFSPSQLLKLEQAFEKNQYVVGAERKQLAQTLNLSETQVKVWFQNRRTKHKRQQQEDEGEGGENKSERKPGEDEDEEGLVLEHEEEELDVENETETH